MTSKLVCLVTLTCAGFGAMAAGLENSQVSVEFKYYAGTLDFGTKTVSNAGVSYELVIGRNDVIFVSPEHIVIDFGNANFSDEYFAYVLTNRDGDFPQNFIYDAGNSTIGFSQSRIFTSGDTMTISLDDLQGGAGQLVLNLASPVPEPETYAMLLAGMGLVGTIAQRRRRNRLADDTLSLDHGAALMGGDNV